MKTFYTLLLFLFLPCLSFAQSVIELKNPSFEGFPKQGEIGDKILQGWHDCGFVMETPPDVHPIPGGVFEVTKLPVDGASYIGMVTRSNDTWEAISQRLPEKLQKDKCYYFSLMLARSLLYKSSNRMHPDSVINYVNPIKVRIWGGTGFCNKGFLLDESSLIINSRWLNYDFSFNLDDDYSHILIEVFYKTPTLYPYNGNVLIDDASHIYEISCDEGANPILDSLKQIRKNRTPINVVKQSVKPHAKEIGVRYYLKKTKQN